METQDFNIKKNKWNSLVIRNYYVHYQNYQNSMLLTSSDMKRTLMYLFLFTNSARENRFQYVRRVYATAINFPCIITLGVVYLWLLTTINFVFFFAKSFNKTFIDHTQGKRLNSKLKSSYLKSFKSSSQSHPLWVTLQQGDAGCDNK